MTIHRFACGEDVLLKAGYASDQRSGAIFTIMRLLPFEATSPRYRVKSEHESFSRVVLEDAIRVPPITEPSAGAMDAGARRAGGPFAARATAEALFARRVSR
jgi:hypothetical protein